jgi:hypothetical protein
VCFISGARQRAYLPCVFSDKQALCRVVKEDSPDEFLLCSDGLTSMLKARGPQFIVRGIKVSRQAPWISHLLFADDCLIFTQASERGAERVSEILDLYSGGSRRLVNKDKSAVFFSENCDEELKQVAHLKLGIPLEALGEKYLGLPTAAGRVADGTFDYVTDRMRGFVQGWSERMLSCAGREVLLKSNAQAVPTYPMSCFKLPANICQKMKSYVSNYWWGSSIDSHKSLAVLDETNSVQRGWWYGLS